MKIESMTATFGKLENQTLVLEPEMNIIHAPNEWGKSTWCAFLVNMFYGLETRVKTTKTALADKEHYAPWSGSPMSGKICLEWNGRKITLERWTKGRTPMGEFRAYETETGIPVLELGGGNWGQVLFGVERSVFQRAGFIRFSDLPVTQDESLRRRLNSLVTTGDETDSGDLLADKLKDLKNKVRYNRSGLLPKAEAERQEVAETLKELQEQRRQADSIRQELESLNAYLGQLENHKQALEYAKAQKRQQRIAEAEADFQNSRQALQVQQALCEKLPDEAQAQQAYAQLQTLQEQQFAFQLDWQVLPEPPQPPTAPMPFSGRNAAEAAAKVEKDAAELECLTAEKKKSFPLWLPGIVAAVAGATLAVLKWRIPGILVAILGVVLLGAYWVQNSGEKRKKSQRLAQAQAITEQYGGGTPADWRETARRYGEQWQKYTEAVEVFRKEQARWKADRESLERTVQMATGGEPLADAIDRQKEIIRKHRELQDRQREYTQKQTLLQQLRECEMPVLPPREPDILAIGEAETDNLLASNRYRLQQQEKRLSQTLGRMEALGDETEKMQHLETLDRRISELEAFYAALELAMQTLSDASAELQRRFAPRIAQQAQKFFSRLTDGRYERLTLTEELAVHAVAAGETVMHPAIWRSDGTVDQLYLALRLAVAGALTPNAPLILDDALVRFDDDRHIAAMQLLQDMAKDRQIILFTCQSREEKALHF